MCRSFARGLNFGRGFGRAASEHNHNHIWVAYTRNMQESSFFINIKEIFALKI